MKPIALLLAIVLIAACSSSESAANPTPTSGDTTTVAPTAAPTTSAPTTAAPTDPNEGTHRYRYVESVEHPDNDCSTSAVVGDELDQTTTFEDSLVTVVFVRDDLPEGSEPGRREFDEQLAPNRWREVKETSDGAVLEHTIEFTETGIVLTTLRDDEPCFYSVRDRIDG